MNEKSKSSPPSILCFLFFSPHIVTSLFFYNSRELTLEVLSVRDEIKQVAHIQSLVAALFKTGRWPDFGLANQ